MTVKDIDGLARQKSDIAYTENISVIGLYYKLRLIYQAFDDKKISVKEAGKAKLQALEDYEHENAKDAEIAELSSRIDQHIRIFADQDKRQMSIEAAHKTCKSA